MKKILHSIMLWGIFIGFFACITHNWLPEDNTYRILAVAQKHVLVSRISDKVKYIFDASSARVTWDGKPLELKDLHSFPTAQIIVRWGKQGWQGIDIDGIATEINVSENLLTERGSPNK